MQEQLKILNFWSQGILFIDNWSCNLSSCVDLISYSTAQGHCIGRPLFARLYIQTHIKQPPLGNGKWPLNRGWPLFKGLWEISIRHAGNISFIPIKIKRSLLSLVTTEASQKDNMCMFECFYVIIFLSQTLICHKVVESQWPLNRGKNNRRYLIRKSEGWPWLLNKGFVYNNILPIFSGLWQLAAYRGVAA